MSANDLSTPHVPTSDRPMGDLTAYISDIRKEIFAQGGMSDIYLANLCRPEANATPTQVAVKFLRGVVKDEEQVIKRRLNRESWLWGRLEHPNILKFHGVCRRDSGHNIYGLVSPRCDGNVIAFLRERPQADKAGLVAEIAEGLYYLHTQGVIHGDMKPSNILMTPEGVPVISDFGTSRIMGYKGFTTNANGRSCRYAPPEVLLWEPPPEDVSNPTAEVSPTALKPSCDVHSFGMTALEILSGKAPFWRINNEARVIITVASGKRPTSDGYDGVSKEFWDLLPQWWHCEAESRPTMEIVVKTMRLMRSVSNGRL